MPNPTDKETKFLHSIAEGVINASPIEAMVIHIKPVGRPAYTGFYGRVTPENLVTIMAALKSTDELRAKWLSEDHTPTSGVDVNTGVLNPSVQCETPGCVIPPHRDGVHYGASGEEFYS